MKKGIRTLILVLSTAVGACVLFCVGVIVNGTCFRRPDSAGERLARWMGELPDDRLLCELVIPGSHDAGTGGMIWCGETQNTSVREQLLFGARYFDLRVRQTDDGRLVIFHDILDGTEFLPILDGIASFLEAHPTETLLLDFQHFSGGSQRAVFDALSERLDRRGMLVQYGNDERDEAEFASQLTLGECRGKAVVFWGDRSWYEGDFLLHRNNDECTEPCMALDSCYLTDCHTGSSEKLIEEGFPLYFEKQAEKADLWGKGVFVLQAQLTDGRILFGPWSRERAHEPVISAWIRGLKDDPARLSAVNVILRDFLTPEKCEEIIDLNRTKGALRYMD